MQRRSGSAAGAVRRRAAVVLVCALVGLFRLLTPGPALALPAGFEDVVVTTVSSPTELAWTPDGRLLITSKTGQLRVYAGGALVATPALDLAAVMCADGERGLGGVAVHPNFAVNRHVYLYYTFKKFGNCNESATNGPVNRLSRFTLPESNVVDLGSEVVLFDTPPLGHDHHNGGDVKFGRDGHLYVTVGDGGSSALGWPRDPGRLLGKIVRLTADGGIPADNPFLGPGTARCKAAGVPPAGSPGGTRCQEVFALGLRNPFRFAFDPNAPGTRFYINDVGQHAWEEIDEGRSGADYGWPIREGPCAANSTTDCGPPPVGMTNPVFWYPHDPVVGGAATGGAFVPNGVWPAPYAGSYLYADYAVDKMYRLVPNGAGGFTAAEFTTARLVASMRFGPHGAGQSLYYISRGGSLIRRIAYIGSLNRAPVARAAADPTSGPLPLQVRFDGRSSTDPDGDPLTYRWDFQNDGVADATGPTADHTYTTAGAYTAKLTVSDARGGADSATLRVDAGNRPPAPTIQVPAEGTTFRVGQTFVLQGAATDPEDGALPPAALTWEVLRHHETHTHPHLEPTAGNGIPITADEPEDLHAAQTSYYEIRLTATDARGLTTTVTRDLRPKKVGVAFVTDPAGLKLTVSGTTVTGPAMVVSWEAYRLHVDAPTQSDALGRPWVFGAWSDGGARTHAVITPPGGATLTATFKPAPTGALTFAAEADARVDQASPAANFGGSTQCKVGTGPAGDSRCYLRFTVAGVTGPVRRAVLRLSAVTDAADAGPVDRVGYSGWSESLITWTNKPGRAGTPRADQGAVAAGSWVEWDVTPFVTGDGTVSLVLLPGSAGGLYLRSREAGSRRPELLVTFDGTAAAGWN